MKPSTAFKIYAFTIGLAFASILFIPKQAHAGTIEGNQDSCTRMAEDLKFAAELRDQGIPWPSILVASETFLEESKATSTSYIKDAEDADTFRMLIYTVYNESTFPPQKIHDTFLAACMKSSV